MKLLDWWSWRFLGWWLYIFKMLVQRRLARFDLHPDQRHVTPLRMIWDCWCLGIPATFANDLLINSPSFDKRRSTTRFASNFPVPRPGSSDFEMTRPEVYEIQPCLGADSAFEYSIETVGILIAVRPKYVWPSRDSRIPWFWGRSMGLHSERWRHPCRPVLHPGQAERNHVLLTLCYGQPMSLLKEVSSDR